MLVSHYELYLKQNRQLSILCSTEFEPAETVLAISITGRLRHNTIQIRSIFILVNSQTGQFRLEWNRNFAVSTTCKNYLYT